MTGPKLKSYLLDQIAHDEEAELLESKEPGCVVAYDYQYSRRIRFYTRLRTLKAFKQIIHTGPSITLTDDQKTEIAKVLTKLGRDVTLNLAGIFILKTPDDMYEICQQLELDDELIPDNLFDENNAGNEILNPELVGMHWFQESIVLINIQAMQTATEAFYEHGSWEYNRELETGFWTTLIHEVRHNQMDSTPYELPWLQDNATTEESVENWARAKYEELF